jgi:hypothetical protein
LIWEGGGPPLCIRTGSLIFRRTMHGDISENWFFKCWEAWLWTLRTSLITIMGLFLCLITAQHWWIPSNLIFVLGEIFLAKFLSS